MRIALNLLYLLPKIGGGSQTYAKSLIFALANLKSGHDFYIFLNQESAGMEVPALPNFHKVVLPFKASFRPRRYYWEQVILPRKLKEINADVVHSLGYVCPLNVPCVNIVSILDVNYVAMSDIMSARRRVALSFFVKASAQASDHIITISHFSKEQIKKHTGVSDEKITVTHLAPPEIIVTSEQSLDFENIYSIDRNRPYICALSSYSLHKNMAGLVSAFEKIADKIPHNLVIIGNLPARVEATITESQYFSRIKSTGYVPSEHLVGLLSSADLFAFPSWYEGFGLPILEAQQLGVPVACSNAASLPEIAGDGAVYFDPHSVDEIADKILLCLNSEMLREKLKAAAKVNLRRFSQEKTACATLQVYETVSRVM